MSLRFALLGILAQKPATGFDLLREFDAARSVIWPAPQNEVYRVLRALKTEGMVEEVARGARGSRTYAATPAGKAALRTWLMADSDYTLRYEPVLKAVFFDQLDPEARTARLAADAAFFDSQIAAIEGAMRDHAVEGQPSPRADAARMAQALYRALAGWARGKN